MTRFFESARADYVTFTLSYFIIFARGINLPHVCVQSQNNMQPGNGLYGNGSRPTWPSDPIGVCPPRETRGGLCRLAHRHATCVWLRGSKTLPPYRQKRRKPAILEVAP